MEGLELGRRLVSKVRYLKLNSFFMVWVRDSVDFRIRAEGVEPKLRPKERTSKSCSDDW